MLGKIKVNERIRNNSIKKFDKTPNFCIKMTDGMSSKTLHAKLNFDFPT